MAQLDKDNQAGEQKEVDTIVRDFVDHLTDEHRLLVVLKSQLYGGSWEPMLNDLKNRLAGKPYIFKLANRINDDMERIEAMQAFEKKYGIDLGDFVDLT